MMTSNGLRDWDEWDSPSRIQYWNGDGWVNKATAKSSRVVSPFNGVETLRWHFGYLCSTRVSMILGHNMTS